MTPEFIEAVLDDRPDRARELIGAKLPEEFPSPHDQRFLEFRLRQMREDSRWETWPPYAVVLGETMIGHAGFHGPPGINSTKNPAAAEFGYTIFEPWRGNGYATRASTMLMDIAEELGGVRHFVLAISPENKPSLAIVRKLGFVRTGEQIDEEDGLEHIFELER